ncbi:flagellar hook-length control protein FliK [Gallaecimonas sp. GXIMD1310]|uniref:flagellar hook-length control protein FliK n=1 Tax=Gallaecimonas sp. GXIMD1310 TaxID=3131926 RepID=UPI00324FA924
MQLPPVSSHGANSASGQPSGHDKGAPFASVMAQHMDHSGKTLPPKKTAVEQSAAKTPSQASAKQPESTSTEQAGAQAAETKPTPAKKTADKSQMPAVDAKKDKKADNSDADSGDALLALVNQSQQQLADKPKSQLASAVSSGDKADKPESAASAAAIKGMASSAKHALADASETAAPDDADEMADSGQKTATQKDDGTVVGRPVTPADKDLKALAAASKHSDSRETKVAGSADSAAAHASKGPLEKPLNKAAPVIAPTLAAKAAATDDSTAAAAGDDNKTAPVSTKIASQSDNKAGKPVSQNSAGADTALGAALNGHQHAQSDKAPADKEANSIATATAQPEATTPVVKPAASAAEQAAMAANQPAHQADAQKVLAEAQQVSALAGKNAERRKATDNSNNNMTSSLLQQGSHNSELSKAQSPQPTQQNALVQDNKQPVNQQQFAQALTERVEVMLAKNLRHAHIKLDPPELGSLMIKVQVHHQDAQVQFQATHAHTREMLQDAMPRLKDMMSQQGFNLSDGQVNDNAQSQSRQQGGQQGSGSHWQGSDEWPEGDESLPYRYQLTANGLVDAYA